MMMRVVVAVTMRTMKMKMMIMEEEEYGSGQDEASHGEVQVRDASGTRIVTMDLRAFSVGLPLPQSQSRPYRI